MTYQEKRILGITVFVIIFVIVVYVGWKWLQGSQSKSTCGPSNGYCTSLKAIK